MSIFEPYISNTNTPLKAMTTSESATPRVSVSAPRTGGVPGTPTKLFGTAPLQSRAIAAPRIAEKEVGESMRHRTEVMAQYRDLGQGDLVHVSKYDKASKKEVGEYHYCLGIDTSSAVQPYMYLQTIQVGDRNQGTVKHPKAATYACYNAFRKGDLRVRCTFPSSAPPSVHFYPADASKPAFIVSNDERGQQVRAETYVSSIVRSILFADDFRRHLPGMAKYNLFQSTKETKEAIAALVQFLPRGPALGCGDVYNKPSPVNNFLVDALLRLVSLSNYHEHALEEIAKVNTDGRYDVVCVRILVHEGANARAVQMMHARLASVPRDGWMLNEQVKLLLSQGRADMAHMSAMRAVEALTTEFSPWGNLIRVHILRKDFKSAMLALNSAPMYVNRKKDVFAALTPASFEFPEPAEGRMDAVWASAEQFGSISGVGGIVEFSSADEVRKVYAEDLQVYEETKLNETFQQAYALLAIMAKQLGWVELLRLRSAIFVMEDEYHEGEDGEALRGKRLSEKWLDSLFIIFYSNLKRVLVWRSEMDASRIGKRELQIGPLQWELIGEEYYKTHHFQEGSFPFKQALGARFSPFAATKILNHYLQAETRWEEYRELHLLHEDAHPDPEWTLKTCLSLISWHARAYTEFPLLCVEVLRTMLARNDLELDTLKAREVEPNMLGLIERLCGWLDQFS